VRRYEVNGEESARHLPIARQAGASNPPSARGCIHSGV